MKNKNIGTLLLAGFLVFLYGISCVITPFVIVFRMAKQNADGLIQWLHADEHEL